MIYNDPLYGQIELDSLITEILEKCPELKKLRYVGMMNFRSINMLGLTNVSRLEHAIGLAYLSQLFSVANDYSEKNNLLVASLYHDINCGPFGHAVEWAIRRFTSYEHETKADWISDEEKNPSIDKPLFIEPNGIHRYRFKERYNLLFEYINGLKNGTTSFIINNNGIDLDNIDNVYRMGFYLGLVTKDKNFPIILSRNLKVIDNYNNFIIGEEFLHLVEHWHNLRSEIYRKFIYSKEYLTYEYLLFLLISKYARHHLSDIEDIYNIWQLTDERLLFKFFEDEKKNFPEISEIAKKLILFNLDKVYSIIRTKQFEQKERLLDENCQNDLLQKVVSKIARYQRINPARLFLHVTTDDRKTEREVLIYIQDKKGNIAPHKIGQDVRYVVIGILGKDELQPKIIQVLTSTMIEILYELGIKDFEVVSFSMNNSTTVPQLSFFD